MLDHRLLVRTGWGAVAGALATAVMSGVMALGAQAHVLGEPPPRKLVRRSLARFGVRPQRQTTNAASIVAHFAFGMGMGALYTLLPRAEHAPPRRALARGTLYGLAIWSASYAGWIPALGLMPRPSRDRPGRPTTMALAHVAYGTVLAALVSSAASPNRSQTV